MSTNEGQRSQPSANAFARMFTIYENEQQGARAMLEGEGYPDFFVEGSGPPWHEFFPDVITAEAQPEISLQRMAYVSSIRPQLRPVDDDDDDDDDGYPDFFVDGGSGPWHELFPDVITAARINELASSPAARVRAYRQLGVVAAYARLKFGSAQ